MLNEKILNSFQNKNHKKVGRYNSSDLYNIIKGDINVDNYFDDNAIDMRGVKNILRGVALENELRNILEKVGYKLKWNDDGGQMKYELKVEDFVIVVCPDFHILNGKEMGHKIDEFCLETKCPNNIKDNIPPWYHYQLECQYQVLKIPIYLTQVNIFDNDWPLLCPLLYKNSPIRWKNLCEKLSQFNKELKNKYER